MGEWAQANAELLFGIGFFLMAAALYGACLMHADSKYGRRK